MRDVHTGHTHDVYMNESRLAYQSVVVYMNESRLTYQSVVMFMNESRLEYKHTHDVHTGACPAT